MQDYLYSVMNFLLHRVVVQNLPADRHDNRTRLGMLVGWVSTVMGGCIFAAVLISIGGCRSVTEPSKKDDREMQAYSESLMGLTSGELLKEAMVQLEAENNEQAIDLMYMYLAELSLRGPREMVIYQDVRFKLASLLMSENRTNEAAQLLEYYIDAPLAERESEAREMLKACAAEIGEKG